MAPRSWSSFDVPESRRAEEFSPSFTGFTGVTSGPDACCGRRSRRAQLKPAQRRQPPSLGRVRARRLKPQVPFPERQGLHVTLLVREQARQGEYGIRVIRPGRDRAAVTCQGVLGPAGVLAQNPEV